MPWQDDTVGIEKLAANVGGSRLSGKIKLSKTAERRRIDASLDADEVSVARLLAPLLDQRLAITGAAEAALSGRQSVWPDEPFSAGAFDALTGNIQLDCRRLVLADGVILEGAQSSPLLSVGGKIDIEDISGKGLGGQFKAKLQIAKARGRRGTAWRLNFGAALEAFAGGNPPRASGPSAAHWNSRVAA